MYGYEVYDREHNLLYESGFLYFSIDDVEDMAKSSLGDIPSAFSYTILYYDD